MTDVPTLEQLLSQSERIRGRELTEDDLNTITPDQAAAERRLEDYHNKVDMVRSFKGCPASIILGLHVTGQPHNNTSSNNSPPTPTNPSGPPSPSSSPRATSNAPRASGSSADRSTKRFYKI